MFEAWAYGLPVICLSLGGPGRIVASTCGRVVPVADRSEDDCIAMLASAIAALAEDEELPRRELSRGAIARSAIFLVEGCHVALRGNWQKAATWGFNSAAATNLGVECGHGCARRRRPLKQASGVPCHRKGRLVALSKHRLDGSSLQILANAFIESLAINDVRFKHRFRGALDIHIAVGKANHK